MTSGLIGSKRPIVLVAGVGSRRQATRSQGQPEPSVTWQVDETVVALTRAAISRGIPLAVPMDLNYAPLVAHVASEYVSPEVAEGESRRTFDGDRGSGMRAVSFVSLGQNSFRPKRRMIPGWAEVFRELNVVSDDVQPFQRFVERVRPLAVVGVGQGPNINAFFTASLSWQLPCWRLATPAGSGGRRPAAGESFSQLMERRLVKLREELVLVPVNGGSRVRDDRNGTDRQDAPPFFRAYPPLALYAQMLMEHLMPDGS